MPIYTEIQQPVILDCSSSENFFNCYVTQILTNKMILKNGPGSTRSSPSFVQNDKSQEDQKCTSLVQRHPNQMSETDRKIRKKLMVLKKNVGLMMQQNYPPPEKALSQPRTHLFFFTPRCSIASKEPTQSLYQLEYRPSTRNFERKPVEEQPDGTDSLTEITEDDSKQSRWLNKQKKFLNVFKTSMENLDNFMVDMNKYVAEIQRRMEALKDCETWHQQLQVMKNDKIKEVKEETSRPSTCKVQNSRKFKTIIKPEDVILGRASFCGRLNQKGVRRSATKRPPSAAECESDQIQIEKDPTLEIVQPDVSKSKALVDLHGKLLHQTEAKDSYICFQKLMDQTEKRVRKEQENRENASRPWRITNDRFENQKRKMKKSGDLCKMFNNSLCFSQKSFRVRKPSVKRPDKPGKTYKRRDVRRISMMSLDDDKVWRQMKKDQELKRQCSLEVTSQNCKMEKKERTKLVHKLLLNSPPVRRTYNDVLDIVTLSDLTPLKSEYPRRDNLGITWSNSYLFQLANDQNLDDMLENLITINEEMCEIVDVTEE